MGERAWHKRVQRLMRAAGLQGRHPKAWKKTTVSGEKPASAPDLIGRDFSAKRPDQRWYGDITYVKTWDGWGYLATVIDRYKSCARPEQRGGPFTVVRHDRGLCRTAADRPSRS